MVQCPPCGSPRHTPSSSLPARTDGHIAEASDTISARERSWPAHSGAVSASGRPGPGASLSSKAILPQQSSRKEILNLWVSDPFVGVKRPFHGSCLRPVKAQVSTLQRTVRKEQWKQVHGWDHHSMRNRITALQLGRPRTPALQSQTPRSILYLSLA